MSVVLDSGNSERFFLISGRKTGAKIGINLLYPAHFARIFSSDSRKMMYYLLFCPTLCCQTAANRRQKRQNRCHRQRMSVPVQGAGGDGGEGAGLAADGGVAR
ncbi:MAG: hypothetical protein IKO12_09390 [Bacteroidaceae bacterium]|nr:hypothetical protein [Bacteroidaceae bacterium]